MSEFVIRDAASMDHYLAGDSCYLAEVLHPERLSLPYGSFSLAHALIAPGGRSRVSALKENALVAVRLLYGAAALTFMAAFIEAFWSPLRSVPFALKIGVGIALWLVTLAYLLLAGRRGSLAS